MAKLNVGDRWYFLTLLEKDSRRGHQSILAKCVCGIVKRIALSSFYAKRPVKSCGCMSKELLRIARTTHGCAMPSDGKPKDARKFKTYECWNRMHERCGNKNRKDFHRYGGRGISICERWGKFENFMADMGVRPDGYSIGRIDNDGNYEPNNCEWQNAKTQARNRSSSRFILFDGRRQTLADWSDQTGLSQDTLQKRISNGWTVSDALTKPPKSMKNSICNWRGAL